MTWAFKPANDLCIDCNASINPKKERNYIVWHEEKKEYRRECAACHDKRLVLPFNRVRSTVISTPPDKGAA